FLRDGIPTPAGAYPGQGLPIRQPDLANTIEHIATNGADSFYHDALPGIISDDVQAGGGKLTAEAFSRIQPIIAEGTRGSYRGYDVVASAGMSGGSTLLELLNIAETYESSDYRRDSGELLALLLEIMRQAWTDRMVYLGDPDGISVPD